MLQSKRDTYFAQGRRHDFRIAAPTQSAMRFRSDVEGLRGIAILAVVTYHAAPSLAPMGYLGVDIFFVISGYLITGMMWRELNATGRIDLLDFWARRIRRIAPAAIAVLLALSAVALTIPDFDGRSFGKDIAAAALSLFNWHQIAQSVDYLAHDDTSNPLLHYWSLSVEEQFYVVWPVALIALACFARPFIFPAVAGIALISLCAALYIAPFDPQLAFFGTGTRVWQLLTGAAIAIAPPLTNRTTRLTTGLVGAVLVATSFTADRGVPYDMVLAFTVTVGAALLIYADAAPITSWLSVAPLAGVGRLSYSLYLWHWPLIVLLPASLGGVPGAVILAFVLAFASYHLVEQPARTSVTLRNSKAATYGLGVVLLMSAVAAGGALIKWGPNSQPVIYKDGCLLSHEAVEYAECAYGNIDGRQTVVLFGDSHAGNWFNAIETAATRQEWRLLVRVKAACSPIDQTQYRIDGNGYPECTAWRETVIDELRTGEPDLIIVTGSREGTPQSQRRVLDKLSAIAPTIAVRDTPTLPMPAPKCLRTNSPEECVWPLSKLQHTARYPTLSAQTLPASVSVLDLSQTMCPGGKCRAMTNGKLTMFDEQHFTASFSASMAPAFETLLQRHGKAVGAGDRN